MSDLSDWSDGFLSVDESDQEINAKKPSAARRVIRDLLPWQSGQMQPRVARLAAPLAVSRRFESDRERHFGTFDMR